MSQVSLWEVDPSEQDLNAQDDASNGKYDFVGEDVIVSPCINTDPFEAFRTDTDAHTYCEQGFGQKAVHSLGCKFRELGWRAGIQFLFEKVGKQAQAANIEAYCAQDLCHIRNVEYT